MHPRMLQLRDRWVGCCLLSRVLVEAEQKVLEPILLICSALCSQTVSGIGLVSTNYYIMDECLQCPLAKSATRLRENTAIQSTLRRYTWLRVIRNPFINERALRCPIGQPWARGTPCTNGPPRKVSLLHLAIEQMASSP